MNIKEEYSKNTDPQLSREQIKTLKSDIISFKKQNHPYKTWIKDRDSFILDYMRSRGLSTDYAVYEQAVYVAMCQGWDLESAVRGD